MKHVISLFILLMMVTGCSTERKTSKEISMDEEIQYVEKVIPIVADIELKEREIADYITEGRLDEIAFYEPDWIETMEISLDEMDQYLSKLQSLDAPQTTNMQEIKLSLDEGAAYYSEANEIVRESIIESEQYLLSQAIKKYAAGRGFFRDAKEMLYQEKERLEAKKNK